jgi:acyl-ACP thioesterase
MELRTIWREEMLVKTSDTDFQKKLKLSNFFVWMQDVASTHAEHLGFGYDDLLELELAWVLSRKKVYFFDFPAMGEKVFVETWPKGIQQKLFFMREHRMTGSDGRVIALSTSAYILVSSKARRMLPPSALPKQIYDNDGLNAVDELLLKIPPVEELSECFNLTPGYSAVDIMQHVNNARYIEWISDCFSMDEHQTRRPKSLQINFLNEIKPGETVTLLRGSRPETPNNWYVTGVNQTNRSKAFEAEISWE